MKPTIANLLTDDRQPLTNISANAPLPHPSHYNALPKIKTPTKRTTEDRITLPPATELLAHAGTKRKLNDAELDGSTFGRDGSHLLPLQPRDENELASSVRSQGPGLVVTENCDQVRVRIRSFLETGQATVKQFCKRIQVSSKSYYSFMSAEGANKGLGNHTYVHAFAYFHNLEKKKVSYLDANREIVIEDTSPTSRNKKQRLDSTFTPPHPYAVGTFGEPSSAGSASHIPVTPSSISTLPVAGSATSTAPNSADTLDNKPSRMTRHEKSVVAQHPEILLDGETEDKVKIFDTCDEIRRKINNYLKKPGVTQAGFIRELLQQYHLPTRPTKLQGNQIATFRNKKGALAGNSSIVYYSSYVFFEKERLALNQPKSTHRLEMEKQWPNGVDTERHTGFTYCLPGERPVEDRYGKIHYHKSR